VEKDLDRELEKAQAALLAHYAPDTRVRRVRWSQGETQLFELGEGPPLLLVHGGGDGAFDWVPILSALARNRRVLVVDRPGHGLADPFDYKGVDLLDHARTFLRDILDALDLPTVDIAANSIGGLLAAAFGVGHARAGFAARARRRTRGGGATLRSCFV
jgi:pimeloyl-ACP methyl ester carboxylesterase